LRGKTPRQKAVGFLSGQRPCPRNAHVPRQRKIISQEE
jgi:hypothetical protein